MNKIYEVDEGRPFWKLRPLNLAITVVTVLLAALVLLGLVVSGPFAVDLGDTLGLGDTTVTMWNIVKLSIMVVVVVFLVAVLYYATPNVKQPKFRWISVGAGMAIIVWILASLAFGLYVANFGSYNKTYGSLAGVIILLLWLWLTNLAPLFRRRGRLRDGALASAASRHPGGGVAATAAQGHPSVREGSVETGGADRTGPRPPRTSQCRRRGGSEVQHIRLSIAIRALECRNLASSRRHGCPTSRSSR